ncbi:MAG: KH domain-containing protein [Chloroflexi bacterium]|nr:KH domain-containing protein [Chloroflexota bacterium]
MSQEKTTLEVIAPTVEDAIQKGLSQLNLPKEAVEVEVLDAGSRGLFGLGSRQARIRLTIKPPAEERLSAQPPAEESLPEVKSQPAAAQAAETRRAEPAAEQGKGEAVAIAAGEEEEVLRVSREVVSTLLEKMMVHAKVTATMRPPEDEADEPVVLINVEGKDLSILIGRRSETLNALQYISSLIICKKLNHWVPLMIDVQGYRERRERQLRQLARRMAEQAIHTKRRQVLEPMPANERRLIHLELRDHELVATESTGEEPNRKVTIFLKK